MGMQTAKQIIEALLEAGETQSSIESGSGVSQATISRILSGTAADPRSSTTAKLAAYAERASRLRGRVKRKSAA